jgi:hypothetical protein
VSQGANHAAHCLQLAQIIRLWLFSSVRKMPDELVHSAKAAGKQPCLLSPRAL